MKNSVDTNHLSSAEDQMVITRQVYYLSGAKANNPKTPNHELTLLTPLDENEFDCVCSELVDGKKEFVIISKNEDSAIRDSAVAGMVEPFKRVAGVSYLENIQDHNVVLRYLICDHTNQEAAEKFFEAVRETIRKDAAHRGWQVGEDGELIKQKAQYFF